MCEVFLALGLHSEKGAAHVDHFPGEEEGEPGKTDEGGSSSAEDGVAFGGIGVVATVAEIAVAETEHDEGEGGEAESGHPKSVDNHVEEHFMGEDADFERVGWAGHDVGRGSFKPESHIGHSCLVVSCFAKFTVRMSDTCRT